MSVMTFDYETFYNDEVSVKVQGAGMYAAHPWTDVYLLSACDDEHSWVGHPSEFPYEVLDNYEGLVSYNAFFEEAISNIALPRMGIPFPVNKLPWLDASDMGAYVFGTTNLNATVKKAFGVTLDKGARSSMKNKTWDDCLEKERLREYARHDSVWTQKLWREWNHAWPHRERMISYITRTNSRYGVKIDTEKLAVYIAAAQQEKYDIERALPWVDELGEKPTGDKAIKNQCRIDGIPCPPVKDHDEDGYNEWERAYAPLHPWIVKVGEWRSVNKVLKTLLTMRARIRPDGTMESPLRYGGATSTLRWSGDGGVNFQNFRKEPIICAGVAIDIRSLIIPRDGKKLIIADLAQIEPRVLNWMIGNKEMLDLMAAGMSPYEAFARTNLGWRGGKLSEEDPKKYAMVKIMVLGLGYGAGWEKFITMADTLSGGNIKLTEEESKATVEMFRNATPLVADKETGLWARLDRDFKRAAETDKHFEIELPTGRVFKYPNIRTSWKTYTEKGIIRRIVDGELIEEVKNIPKKKKVHLVEVDGRIKNVYGGLITENLCQTIARDAFCDCLLSLHGAGVRVPFTVHDEAVCEVDEDVKAEDIEELMAVKPDWAPGLPIKAEAKEVPHYKK